MKKSQPDKRWLVPRCLAWSKVIIILLQRSHLTDLNITLQTGHMTHRTQWSRCVRTSQLSSFFCSDFTTFRINCQRKRGHTLLYVPQSNRIIIQFPITTEWWPGSIYCVAVSSGGCGQQGVTWPLNLFLGSALILINCDQGECRVAREHSLCTERCNCSWPGDSFGGVPVIQMVMWVSGTLFVACWLATIYRGNLLHYHNYNTRMNNSSIHWYKWAVPVQGVGGQTDSSASSIMQMCNSS